MSKRIYFFNMIEVLLALTVIAIGMTSILGLFPVGLNASRNAIAENSSSDIADQLTTYFKVINEADDGTNYNANFKTTDTSSYYEDPYNDDAVQDEIKTQSDGFLEAYNAGDITKTDDYGRVADGWAIFKTKKNELKKRMFFIVQGPNCTEDTGERRIDFSAMALVWKSTVQIKRLKAGGTPANASDWELWPDPASYDYSSKLNIELSWPLDLPYSERKKRYYQIVITNPNP